MKVMVDKPTNHRLFKKNFKMPIQDNLYHIQLVFNTYTKIRNQVDIIGENSQQNHNKIANLELLY